MTKKEKDTLSAFSIFEEPKGKLVLEYFENEFFMKETPFNPDPYVTAFNCGLQSFYQKIIRNIEELHKPAKRQEKAEEEEE